MQHPRPAHHILGRHTQAAGADGRHSAAKDGLKPALIQLRGWLPLSEDGSRGSQARATQFDGRAIWEGAIGAVWEQQTIRIYPLTP